VDTVHAVQSHDALYARNGLQFLPFNTLYQLAADPDIHDADRMLLVPDLLAWWLTGRMAAERTNASTTGLLDVHTQEWDDELIARLGIPRDLLADLVDPGDVLGTVLPGIATTLGLDPDAHDFPEVVAVGSHDTASAVVAVPMLTPDAAYISCGTWALVGVELAQPVVTDAAREANFTNEGGVDGRTRFLTNVMGLWLLNESVRAWGAADELGDLLRAAAAEPPPAATFDVQDPTFMPPDDMPDRITRWSVVAGLEPPRSRPAMVRAIVESLAQAFADAVDRAAALSGREVRAVHLVGGGALNDLLCQCVADRAGLPVLAGPVEATAIGNLLVQARTAGALRGDLEVLRALVAATHEPRRFPPRTAAARMGR
jgi:rhamnulokinase